MQIILKDLLCLGNSPTHMFSLYHPRNALLGQLKYKKFQAYVYMWY